MQKTFTYAANSAALGAGLLAASLLSPVFWYLGQRGNSVLMIMDLFTLTREATTTVYYAGAAILAIGLPLGIFLIWAGKRSSGRIVLTGDGLIVPYGRFVMRDRHIPFVAIRKATVRTLAGRRFLWMDAEGGMQVIAEQLVGGGGFPEIVAAVEKRTPVR